MPYYSDYMELEIRKVRALIEQKAYRIVGDLNTVIYKTKEPLPYNRRMGGEEQRVKIGEVWGELWDCAWFHFTGDVPSCAKGEKVVALLDISGEMCVFDESGCPIEGITSVKQWYPTELGSPAKHVFPLYAVSEGNEHIDFWADGGNNDLFGSLVGEGKLLEANIAICNPELVALGYDLEVLFELYEGLPNAKARKHALFHGMYQAVLQMADYTEEEAHAARAILRPLLDKKNGDAALTMVAVGHAHLDLAWGWPIRESLRKGARTFSTAIANIERYPDYVFGASQAQLYAWMKEHYPQLYTKIKPLVDAGRWEVQGALWVETDTNLPNGESLIRQVLYGKRYFREEFDQDMKIAWLPDTFGYTGALPQILKKSGVDYMMTVKIHGNRYDKLAHHTFLWKGIDGTSVLTHMPPEAYNSSAAPHAILSLEEGYAEKGITDECLLMYGIGDGGAGPGEAHLERLARSKNLEGMPPVRQAKAIEFFDHLAEGADRYHTWQGEMYFECHQGTYTSEALCKKNNRRMEQALHELELFEAAAGGGIAKERLDDIWREMLLYQFHDILPGSSIGRVYSEANARYVELLNEVYEATRAAQEKLIKKADTSAYKKPYVLFNSLSWEREEWVQLDEGWIKARVPALGFAVTEGAQIVECPEISASGNTLSNGVLTVVLDDEGYITSVRELATGREVVTGQANRLTLYHDESETGSTAWDFPPLVRDRKTEVARLVSRQMRTEGPRAICTQKFIINASVIEQEIILTAGSQRVDFRTKVDWRERGRMLRTSFPVDVKSDQAVCDIQFGSVSRPTHANTTWDIAKYEIYAHKWIDLSQTDRGVALLNDCKYGHSVQDNVIDLNLLRSTESPDMNADVGEHEFTYSLFPHTGNHITGEVNRAGYELNLPIKALRAEPHAGIVTEWSIATTDGVIIETVKHSEDGSALILRLYESNGGTAKVALKPGFAVREAVLVNLMEEPLADGELNAGDLTLTLQPFEICTVKLTPDGDVLG